MNLAEALTIPNLAKEAAKKNDTWGWQQMDDFIELWSLDGDWMVMPRGFALAFGEGMRLYDQVIDWTDNRTFERLPVAGEQQFPPFKWQSPQIDSIAARHQGILKSPAGSGKTVAVLFSIQEASCKSLVIVNTKDILWQWQDRAREYLGEDFPVGQIGDNIFEPSDYLTIATAQTLHSRYEELEQLGFFDEFSYVCLDECHHATAETYNRILDRFSARFRIGVSATPDKTGDFALATAVLGPIIHTTHHSEVDNLVMPELVKVPTKFGFGFRGTINRWQRSNYPQMIQALITNPERNELIANVLKYEEGTHSLLISKRLEHLDILESMMWDADYDGHVLKLTGKESRDERQRVVEISNSEPSLVLSTLADEALDVPRLDRGFLVFPQKNPGLITQQVGRFERKHPDKKDAKIYDFTDLNVGPLEKQWRVRRFEVYEPRGYSIVTRKAEEFLQMELL